MKQQKKELELTPGWYSCPPIFRHIAVVYVPPEFIIDIIRGTIKCDPAIFPEDVQVISAEWNNESKSFVLTITSESYPETTDGCIPYVYSLRMKR